jgi:hypothetical protein
LDEEFDFAPVATDEKPKLLTAAGDQACFV